MPATFEFSLEPLLRQRKHVEEEKQRTLADCRSALEQCALEMRRLAMVRRRSVTELTEAAKSRPTGELRLRDGHLRRLDALCDVERRRRADLEAACELARNEVIGARRERRVIEILKERRRAAFEVALARREELEIEEGNARLRERAMRDRLARRKTEGGTR
jgi:flagellar protein FliJ